MTIQILTQQELEDFQSYWKTHNFKSILRDVITQMKIVTNISNPMNVHPVVNWLLMLQASGEMDIFLSRAGGFESPRYLDEAVGLAIGLSSWPHQSSIEYINPRYKELHEFFDGLVNTDEKFKSLVEDLLNTGFSIHEYSDRS